MLLAYVSLIKDLSNLANSLMIFFTADQRSNVVLQNYAKMPQQLLTFSNPYKQDQTDFCLFLWGSKTNEGQINACNAFCDSQPKLSQCNIKIIKLTLIKIISRGMGGEYLY